MQGVEGKKRGYGGSQYEEPGTKGPRSASKFQRLLLSNSVSLRSCFPHEGAFYLPGVKKEAAYRAIPDRRGPPVCST